MTIIRTTFALLLPSLSLIACAVQSGEPTGPEEKLGQVKQELRTGPEGLPSGSDCHTAESTGVHGPILFGTMTGGWCCGDAECNDEESCGEDYGRLVQACSSCDAYTCLPGPFRTGPGGSGSGVHLGTGGLAATP
jgi:hypothetical protein